MRVEEEKTGEHKIELVNVKEMAGKWRKEQKLGRHKRSWAKAFSPVVSSRIGSGGLSKF